MKRKIIKQGHNTLTVTLPIDWVKRLGLSAGDEIELTEKDHALIISGHEQPKHKVAIIDIRNFTIPLLWRYFQSAYRYGCDEITLQFDPDKKDYEDAYHFYTTQFDYSKLGEKIPPKPALMMIQGLVDRFVGLSIIETGKGFCTIREIAQLSPKEFENSLRRIFLILNQMLERMIELIKTNEKRDVSVCKEFHTVDMSVDKLVDYCSRILHKNTTCFNDHKKTMLFTTLYILELMGDEVKYIGKHLATAKKAPIAVTPLVEALKAQFALYYKLYYSYSRETAILFGNGDLEIYSKHFDARCDFNSDERSIAKHLMIMSKFILTLVELRIEMEFETITSVNIEHSEH